MTKESIDDSGEKREVVLVLVEPSEPQEDKKSRVSDLLVAVAIPDNSLEKIDALAPEEGTLGLSPPIVGYLGPEAEAESLGPPAAFPPAPALVRVGTDAGIPVDPRGTSTPGAHAVNPAPFHRASEDGSVDERSESSASSTTGPELEPDPNLGLVVEYSHRSSVRHSSYSHVVLFSFLEKSQQLQQ
jgi:hypothetical protein